MSGTETYTETRAAEIIAANLHQEGAALPILHALQEAFGHVPQGAIPLVAHALNLSRAELHGIVTFYHDFHDRPQGRHVVKLCRAEACQAVGGDALALYAREQLRIGWGETSLDGRVTLQPVFCLGLCACSPAAMIDEKVVGGLTREKLGALLDGIKRS